MEEEFKKNKNKKGEKESSQSEEKDSSESKETEEKLIESSQRAVNGSLSTISEASVVVQSPGTSGNVERLQE